MVESPLKAAASLVIDSLKLSIGSGRLAPGAPIRQDQIAAELGVSHIPVREALRQLESEGLVVAAHNRGMTVAVLSEAEAVELTEFRALLEAHLTARAVPRLTDDDLAYAEGLVNAIDVAPDTPEVTRLNAEFHRSLYRRADAPYFLRAVEQARVNLGRYLIMTWGSPGQMDRSQDDHRQILEACRRRDADAASQIVERHVRAIGATIVDQIRRQELADLARPRPQRRRRAAEKNDI